jgi:pantoate kinase
MESRPPAKVIVDVPHRISGFFEPVDVEMGRAVQDLARAGSRGGGPALTAFGHTSVELLPTSPSESRCRIFINEKEVNQEARTTAFVFQQFLDYLKSPVEVEIRHVFDLPIGCGYGASGAGAIGTAVGLTCVLGLPITLNQAGKIAHIAEVMNKTGLGTVGGQLFAGFNITTQAGFPFILDKLIVPPGTKIVCGTFGPVYTKTILGSWEWKEKIRRVGAKAFDALFTRPNIQNFMDVSRKFVMDVGMLEALHLDNVRDLMKDLNSLKIVGASMNQLGQSVYAICNDKQVPTVKKAFEKHKITNGPWDLEVCFQGPVLRVP